jgi:PPP family 3-phenylpropionic acid transporter
MIEVFYFFFFMSVGVYTPYLSPYLRGLGFSGRQISFVFSVQPVLALALPLAWAWIADHTRKHARVLQVATAGAAVGFVPVVFARSFTGVLAGWAAYALFNVGISGLADALAAARVRAGADYGRMRLWGSVGFMVTAALGGLVLTARGARPADPAVPVMMALALAGAFVAALRQRGTGEVGARPRIHDIATLVADRRFRTLLLVAPIHWACCAPYNAFFGVFMRDRNLSPAMLGASFCVGVSAEVAVLYAFRRLRARFDLELLLAIAFGASAVRWAAVSQVHSMAALVALQSLHGLTLGLFLGAGVSLIAATVPPSLRASGQALFVIAFNGVGSIIGNLGTGALYDAGGGTVVFLVAAAAELVPLAIVLRARKRLRDQGSAVIVPGP